MSSDNIRHFLGGLRIIFFVLVFCCDLTTFSDVSIVSLFGGVKTCTFSKRCLQSPGMHALGVVGGVIDVVYLFTLIYRVPLVLSSMISNTKSMIFSDERLLLVHLRRLLSPFYATQKNLIADRTGRDKRWAWHGGALKGICCSASCFSVDAPNNWSLS